MTIGGLWSDHAGRRGYVWCDSEIYSAQHDPAGEACKLSVNAIARTAGTGCGHRAGNAAANEALYKVTSLDAAMQVLPDVLDRAYRDADRENGRSICFGLLGFSYRYNRLIGYQFPIAGHFLPRLCRCAAWPEIPDIWRSMMRGM
jgi:hypothetical protein